MGRQKVYTEHEQQAYRDGRTMATCPSARITPNFQRKNAFEKAIRIRYFGTRQAITMIRVCRLGWNTIMTVDEPSNFGQQRGRLVQTLSEGVVNLSNLVVQLMEIKNNTHAAYALTAASLVDRLLGERIQAKLRPMSSEMTRRLFEGYGPISSIASRIDMAFAMSIIDEDMHRKARLVNTVRVAFAHSMAIRTFAEPELIPVSRFSDSGS